MAEKKKRWGVPSALGATTLLVVFAVLCLTVFALLALSTVQADRRLADASHRAVTDYYAADTAAQEALACLRSGTPLPEAVAATASIEEETAGGVTWTYTVPISQLQELRVAVRVEEKGGYEILRWQAAPVGEWAPDDSLDLWDGT